MAIDIANARVGDGPVAPDMGGNEPVMDQNAQAAFSAQPQYQQQYNNESILDILSRFNSMSSLSAQGSEYVTKLTAELQKPLTADNLQIQVRQLNRPNSTIAVICNGQAIILMFAEAVQHAANMATISLSDTAAAALRESVPGVGLLSVIVVTPDDYPKMQIMANDLRNTFLAITTQATDALCNQLLRSSVITFSDDRNEYDTIVNVLDPHAVKVRADLTLVLYASQHQMRQNQMTEQAQYFQQNTQDRMVLGVVGGYLETARDEMLGSYKIQPTFHISYMNSPIKDPKIIPVLLAAAKKRFIDTGAWLSQYDMGLMGGAGKPVINLGALIPDENDPSGRWVLDTPNKMMQFKQVALGNLSVVLDVTEGRAKIPGLEFFSDYEGNADVVATINSFLGVNVFTPEIMVGSKEESVYSGTFSRGPMKFDTAYIDFLNEYQIHPTEASRLEKLCFKRSDPTMKLTEMREIEPDAQFYYRTDFVLLSAEVMTELSRQMGVLNAGSFGPNGIFNMSNYQANGAAWARAQQNVQYGVNGGTYFNPMGYIYRQ